MSEDFYTHYKDVGVSLQLVAMHALRLTFAMVSFTLNTTLVWVTWRTEKLHGVCNWLIATDSLLLALYELSPFVSLWLALSGQNFLPLHTCFFWQLVPYTGITLSAGMVMIIAVERALNILFPIWAMKKQNANGYLLLMMLANIGYAIWLGYLCYTVCMKKQQTFVMCSLIDIYQDEAAATAFRNGIIINSTAVCVYLLIWLLIRRKRTTTTQVAPQITRGNKTVVQQKQQPQSTFVVGNHFSRTLFRSLTAQMFIIFFGFLLNQINRLCMPLLHLDSFQTVYYLSLFSNISTVVSASNVPVLYLMSTNYRSAFQKFFKDIGLRTWNAGGGGVPTALQQNAWTTSRAAMG